MKMKKNILILSSILIAFCGHSQTANKNYITNYVPRLATNNETAVTAANPTNCMKTVYYFDGLGRLTQTNQRNASANADMDVITSMTYDQFGRRERQYLPFAAAKNGAYHTLPTASSNFTCYDTNDQAYAFSQTIYESSPLNRVEKQAAPGLAWHNGSGHEIKVEYGTNTSKRSGVLLSGCER